MKNQYVGDIGDYGKYGLLKYLALRDIIIGVNWYLTENDDSNDGKHIAYLKNEKRKAIRLDWHAKAMKALNPAQLIFADPDNGTIGTKSSTSKDAEKYTTLEELVDYYNRGQDVVYYCQRARRTDDQWTDKKNELKVVLPNVKIAVLTFKRGTQRSYIFGIHPERYAKYNQLIEGFDLFE